MDAVGVDEAGAGAGELAVPDAVCEFGELESLLFVAALGVEEAEFYLFCSWCHEREVDACLGCCGAQGVWSSWVQHDG